MNVCVMYVCVFIDSLAGIWDLQFNIDSGRGSRHITVCEGKVTVKSQDNILLMPAVAIEPKALDVVCKPHNQSHSQYPCTIGWSCVQWFVQWTAKYALSGFNSSTEKIQYKRVTRQVRLVGKIFKYYIMCPSFLNLCRFNGILFQF